MIERQTALDINAAGLWEVLTDPDLLAEWFGATIEWTIEPGGSLHAFDDCGLSRDGIVVEVEAERRLCFLWWPSDEPDCISEVTYTIEPVDEGSVLTIVERPVFDPVSAISTMSTTVMLMASDERWSAWDTRGIGIVECARTSLSSIRL